MNTLKHIEQRQKTWGKVEETLKRRRRNLKAKEVVRLSHDYRSLCTDLSLTGVCQLPEHSVRYLHDLVGRVRAYFYGRWQWKRGRGFRFFFDELPRHLRDEPFVRLSLALFWGPFLISCLLASQSSQYVDAVIGPVMAAQMEQMYSEGFDQRSLFQGAAGTNFYIFHNVSIGLQCYAMGLLFGLGSVYALLFNGVILGTVFGFMLAGPHGATFGEFVMAHGPFELTGICLCGAAGLRMGFSLIDTNGLRRWESLRLSLNRSLPIVGLAAGMIALAAFIEGFISPSELPPAIKAAVMVITALTILVYFLSPYLRGRK